MTKLPLSEIRQGWFILILCKSILKVKTTGQIYCDRMGNLPSLAMDKR